jgi:hypothetical protein
MLGTLILFNGIFISILGFMTTLGLTSETTAKWHEIGVSHETADMFGLSFLGAGIVILGIGWLMRRGK